MKQLYVVVFVLMVASGAVMKYMYDRVQTLNLEVDRLTEQSEQISKDIKALENLEQKRRAGEQKQEKSATKLRKDATRESTVVAKPKLVEKMVNESFNKMAAELSESTK